MFLHFLPAMRQFFFNCFISSLLHEGVGSSVIICLFFARVELICKDLTVVLLN